uniref:uncharacterized protein LOC122591765 n=1 Tax=Erigeron canadensis TaxID=72917 RepID=UPI001CB95092|nr:uncharacterized protein LOC122591765 [Erigeron canadensis]
MGRFDSKNANRGRVMAAVEPVKKPYVGPHPHCGRCNRHHPANVQCGACFNCNRLGHMAKECRAPRGGTGPLNVAPIQALPPQGNQRRGECYVCGSPNHYRNNCPQWVGQQVQVAVHPNQLQIAGPNQNRGQQGHQVQPRGRAFAVNANEARNDPNVVAETVNGTLAKLSQILRDCILTLNDIEFYIDLMPFEIGSFDVIVGMDWLTAVNATIDCGERVVKIPLSSGKILRVQGETSDSLNSKVFSATISKVELKTVPIVCEFSDVFPEELPGLPHLVNLTFVSILFREPHPWQKLLIDLPSLKCKNSKLNLRNFKRKVSSVLVNLLGVLPFSLSRRKTGRLECV